MRHWLPLLFLFASCAVEKKALRSDMEPLLEDSTLQHATLGVAVFDPEKKKYIIDYNSEKYFVPASNTKLFTCYAAMKYLGDSLPGIRYATTASGVILFPTGDPTLLHPDYSWQPVISFLHNLSVPLAISDASWQDKALGAGWSWDDYNDYYMVERSPLPVYGNVLRWIQQRDESANQNSDNPFDQSVSIYSLPEVDWKVRFNPDMKTHVFHVERQRDENVFRITEGNEKHREQDVPFVTHGLQSALELLPDTIGQSITVLDQLPPNPGPLELIRSQPLDSLLKPMMYRSDNFFAEQTLLMVSNERLHVMNDRKIIDSLLRTDFRGLPQPPSWVDGSGLSRYNLFSPRDFVWVLDRMKSNFGLERMKHILPTGGTGTLSHYYQADSSYIYGKTGTLSGVLAFSGFLITRTNRLLFFSILINNHRGSTGGIRRKIETFLTALRLNH